MTRGQYHIPNVTPPYRPTTSPVKTEKQRCEASGGTWTLYVYDPGVRQEACIPYIKPRLCQASVTLTAAGGAALNACSTLPSALACTLAAIMAAASCEDGPIEKVFFLRGGYDVKS